MFRLPSPGDVVAGIGNVMQRSEDFVSGTLNRAVDAIESHADNATTMPVPVTGANGATQNLSGVVSVDEFNRFKRDVSAAFSAVRDDVAANNAGQQELYQGGSSNGGGLGGGGNNLLLLLALSGGLTGGTTTSTISPLLLILLLGGMGNSNGGISLGMAAALGVI